MNHASSATVVLKQLETSLVSGKLPAKAMRAGEHLLERLKSPVRTVILGLSGSGKSQLLNLLAGQCIVPNDAKLPPLELSWAEQSRTIVTLADGTVETHEGIVLQELAGTNAAFVKIATRLPILERISLLEVIADGSIAVRQITLTGRLDVQISFFGAHRNSGRKNARCGPMCLMH